MYVMRDSPPMYYEHLEWFLPRPLGLVIEACDKTE